jgi:hypothetical protein
VKRTQSDTVEVTGSHCKSLQVTGKSVQATAHPHRRADGPDRPGDDDSHQQQQQQRRTGRTGLRALTPPTSPYPACGPALLRRSAAGPACGPALLPAASRNFTPQGQRRGSRHVKLGQGCHDAGSCKTWERNSSHVLRTHGRPYPRPASRACIHRQSIQGGDRVRMSGVRHVSRGNSPPLDQWFGRSSNA